MPFPGGPRRRPMQPEPVGMSDGGEVCPNCGQYMENGTDQEPYDSMSEDLEPFDHKVRFVDSMKRKGY